MATRCHIMTNRAEWQGKDWPEAGVEERENAVTNKRKPDVLTGLEVNVGQRAPDFKALDTNLQEVTLSQSKGKIRLLSAVDSLDQAVWDGHVQLWEREAGKYLNIVLYIITMDLPSALERYYRTYNFENLKILSDYRDASFGMAYGLLIQGTRHLSRGIFVVDADEMVRYADYAKETTQAPDYDKAMKVLKDAAEECTRD
jgi:thioredoxin-dependent peroxiredoxin